MFQYRPIFDQRSIPHENFDIEYPKKGEYYNPAETLVNGHFLGVGESWTSRWKRFGCWETDLCWGTFNLPVQFSLLILSSWGTGGNIDHPIDTESITAKNNHYWVSYPLKPNIFQSTKFCDQSIVIYGSISESKIGSKQLLQESWTVEILSTIVIYSGAINVSIRMARSTQYLGKEKQKTLCQKGYIEPNLCYC